MNTKDCGIVDSLNQAFTVIPSSNNNNEGKEDEKKNASEWDQFENPGTAFLGPQLWEKPVACETELKLEYMDLDDFLNEKNIDDELLKRTLAGLPHSLPQSLPQEEKSPETPAELTQLLSTLASENSLLTSSPGSSKTGCSSPVSRLALDYANSSPKSDPKSPLSPSSSLSDYKEDFDPRSHPFSEDELKRLPMSKKSQKRYIPHEMKDDRYWARRRKNNMAAKRSRDARRMKENQIALRAIFLEKENNNLRNELDKTRSILEMMKKRLDAYEPHQ